jgi:hypothetical protein
MKKLTVDAQTAAGISIMHDGLLHHLASLNVRKAIERRSLGLAQRPHWEHCYFVQNVYFVWWLRDGAIAPFE